MTSIGEFHSDQDQVFRMRMIAVLMALAGLCDRLRCSRRPVRKFVVWILRPAENVARDFVLREAYARHVRALPAALFETPRGNRLAEAERLALCFRAMAWALDWLSAPGRAECPPGWAMQSTGLLVQRRSHNSVVDTVMHGVRGLARSVIVRPMLRDDSS